MFILRKLQPSRIWHPVVWHKNLLPPFSGKNCDIEYFRRNIPTKELDTSLCTHYIPKDRTLYNHGCEDLKSCMKILVSKIWTPQISARKQNYEFLENSYNDSD
jgi:hypothetical protein